jgi:hypothetical protein
MFAFDDHDTSANRSVIERCAYGSEVVGEPNIGLEAVWPVEAEPIHVEVRVGLSLISARHFEFARPDQSGHEFVARHRHVRLPWDAFGARSALSYKCRPVS